MDELASHAAHDSHTEDLAAGTEHGLHDEAATHDEDPANGNATRYLARVSAWWIHVTGREGHEPMSYYDQ